MIFYDDLEQLVKFKEKLDALTSNKTDLNKFFEYASKQIALRFLERVIPATPVEKNQTIKYRMIDGQIGVKDIRGGTLRRGWTGGKDIDESVYIQTLPVIHKGQVHELTISNNVKYAAAVEYGHAQKVGKFIPYLGREVDGVRQGATLKKPRVKGQFMMKNTARDIEKMSQGLAEKLIYEYLKKYF